MGKNLYEALEDGRFHGMSMGRVRDIAFAVLRCLQLLEKEKIVHGDLKPENILLPQMHSGKVKVADFGVSFREGERDYDVIQTLFYRAPEVLMGHEFSRPVDMWSLGCILAELHTGVLLFARNEEEEQMSCIMQVLGVPSAELLETASNRDMFFSKHFVY